jgi:cell division protein FtsI (penicillin-binding protein 3)
MDALSILENLGLKVDFTGEGEVQKQSVKAGQSLNNIKQVKLELG